MPGQLFLLDKFGHFWNFYKLWDYSHVEKKSPVKMVKLP